MLKRLLFRQNLLIPLQPPSGGCVLKLLALGRTYFTILQPPSGGCVLKQQVFLLPKSHNYAATFGWLCVETVAEHHVVTGLQAATFGWLCVETIILLLSKL